MLSPSDPVLLRSCVRKMRGHTNAQLVKASDGHAYVTKYITNPFGSRALIAECVGNNLLRLIGLPAPASAVVDCVATHLDVPEGLHIGSRYPGDPLSTPVYDFLPTRLLERVRDWNRLASGVFVFDIWTANTEMRQHVFTRVHSGWQASFVDNTHLFGGPPEWGFSTTPATGTLISQPLFGLDLIPEDFVSWISHVQKCTAALDDIRQSVPDEWLMQGDEREIERVFAELGDRANNLRELVERRITNHVSSGAAPGRGPSVAPELQWQRGNVNL